MSSKTSVQSETSATGGGRRKDTDDARSDRAESGLQRSEPGENVGSTIVGDEHPHEDYYALHEEKTEEAVFAHLAVLIFLTFVLMVFHLCVVAMVWNPRYALENCADERCSQCLPGTAHSSNIALCDVLTSNEVFWTDKLGAACSCRLSTPPFVVLDEGNTDLEGEHFLKKNSAFPPRFLRDRSSRRDHAADEKTETKPTSFDDPFVHCIPPAYPYVIETSPTLVPFVVLQFRGCQIDDVRKLNDKSLSYLDKPGNPVDNFAAKS